MGEVYGTEIAPAFPAYRPSLAKKYLMIFKRFDDICGLCDKIGSGGA